MSVPQIPNLSSFRRGGLRGRVRDQGSTGIRNDASQLLRQTNKDDIVRNTDNDAATSRLSAVEAGYLDDPFAKLLSTDEVSRRLPLMNRGTYVRTTGIDRIVDTFLASQPTQRKQIVSLGAGSDTRYFRLKQKRPELDVIYHELDFSSNTRSKIARLQSPPFVNAAKNLCTLDPLSSDYEVLEDGTRLRSPDYCIHPQDLRSLSPGKPLLPNIDTSLPTLLISECCLIYLPPGDADAVLQYFTSIVPPTTPLAIVLYEPIRPYDAFGKTMVSNLTARGIHLQTLEKYADVLEQRKRLEQHGFGGEDRMADAHAASIDFIWRRWIDEEEKERVDGLEWMDEVEEFVLLAQHYCICWGWRGFADGSLWQGLPSPE